MFIHATTVAEMRGRRMKKPLLIGVDQQGWNQSSKRCPQAVYLAMNRKNGLT